MADRSKISYRVNNKPFPTYNKSAADDFENIQEKAQKIPLKKKEQ